MGSYLWVLSGYKYGSLSHITMVTLSLYGQVWSQGSHGELRHDWAVAVWEDEGKRWESEDKRELGAVET